MIHVSRGVGRCNRGSCGCLASRWLWGEQLQWQVREQLPFKHKLPESAAGEQASD